MTDVAAYCLSLPGVEETYPFGPQATVFKVGGKVFAIMPAEAPPQTVTLKCDPERAIILRQDFPEIVPGYHTNKRHWNTVGLRGGVPEALVKELVRHSYELVAGNPLQ